MKFHAPSFLHYFEPLFDYSFDVFTHNWVTYVRTRNQYFTQRKLQTLIAEALIKSLDAPIGKPDGPRQRSLLDAPIDTHIEALQDALFDRCDYLQKATVTAHIEGERHVIYEWRVDLRLLQQIVIEIRREQDAELARQIISGNIYMSDRLLQQLLLRSVGVAFSERRTREVMRRLEELGALRNNGSVRTHGREVLI